MQRPPHPTEKRRRRLRKLGAPPLVEVAYAGPPNLGLDDRASLLATLRAALDKRGLQVAEIRGGWGYRPQATGAEVLSRLDADEEVADAKGHWWRSDVVWRSRNDQTVVVYTGDPDGSDLTFQGGVPTLPVVSRPS